MGKKQDATEETPAQRAMAQMAADKMADWKQRWLPVQQKVIEGIKSAGQPDSAKRREAAGFANVENAVQFAGARSGLDEALAGGNIDISSSKAKLARSSIDTSQSVSRALGVAGADQQVDDAYIAGLSSIMALGQGQKATAETGFAQGAQMAERQAAADAAQALANSGAKTQLAGTVIGAGVGYGLDKFMTPANGAGGNGTQHSGGSFGGQQANNPSAYTAPAGVDYSLAGGRF